MSSLSVSALINALNTLANQHGATVEANELFATVHRIALRGLGVGGGAGVSQSGEVAALDYVAKRFRAEPELTIFDVGANVGAYSRIVLDRIPNVRLHAFEPSSACAQPLRERAGDPRCECHAFGFSDRDGEETLHGNSAGSTLSSLHKRRLDHFGIQFDRTERIQLRRIDTFCAERSIERLHLLKLDVEGHELAALRGAERMLAERRIDMIQFEFGGTNIDSRTFFQDFWYLLQGFAIHRILRNGLAQIKTYRESEEMFIAQNFLAVRRDLL